MTSLDERRQKDMDDQVHVSGHELQALAAARGNTDYYKDDPGSYALWRYGWRRDMRPR